MADRILLLVEGKDELTYFKRLGQTTFGVKKGEARIERATKSKPYSNFSF